MANYKQMTNEDLAWDLEILLLEIKEAQAVLDAARLEWSLAADEARKRT